LSPHALPVSIVADFEDLELEGSGGNVDLDLYRLVGVLSH
jgi:hypothetical protein